MVVALVLITACAPSREKPTIGNRSYANFQEVSIPMPRGLNVVGASCSNDGSRANVSISIAGAFESLDGPIIIEAYFDAKQDAMIQSRVIVWTSGGYRFGSLDGTGTAAAYRRNQVGDRTSWKRLGDATVKLDGNELELEGDLGVADPVPDMIVIRHAPGEFMKAHPSFRFSSDGVASTITYRDDKIHSRPLPRLPDDSEIVD